MKYLSFFRLRFAMGLQYRTAALAGIVTQFVWGFMEIMIFKAFYRADAASFPMSFQATVSYIWLQQAFLSLFAAWMMDNEIFPMIINGDVAYELCRPVSIYDMWFARNAANRLARAVLRCLPILAVAAFLPEPYGIAAPAGLSCFVMFLLAMVLGLLLCPGKRKFRGYTTRLRHKKENKVRVRHRYDSGRAADFSVLPLFFMKAKSFCLHQFEL